MTLSNANTKKAIVKVVASLALALGAMNFAVGCDDDSSSYWNPGVGFRGGNFNQGLPGSTYNGSNCSQNPMLPWC